MDTKQCPYCNEKVLEVAKKCKHCGEWINNSGANMQNRMPVHTRTQNAPNPNQTIIIQTPQPPQRNGMGMAGFLLALLTICFSWTPVLNFILWFLGFLFSFIGMFIKPRGYAIAGFIISMIGIILILIIVGGLFAIFGAFD